MIINFHDLSKYDFELSEINVIHQRPNYRRLVVSSRYVNGFLVIVQGFCRYTFENSEISLFPDSVVYLPSGSKHILEIESEDIEFFRIDFRLKIDGEIALFSDCPLKICNTLSQEGSEAVRALMDTCVYRPNTIRKTELICTIFRAISSSSDSARTDRLAPAARYLAENYMNNVDCAQLAKLCHLSSSQFYNLFREEYKTSPLAYRDSLIVQRAKILLEDMFLVTEVADILGFESVSYFSRFFKKHCGIPPLKYQKMSMGGEAYRLP